MTWIPRTLLAVALVLAMSIGASLSAQPSGSSTYPVYNVAYSTALETITPLTGSGVLHTVCVTDAATAGGLATIYDNTAASGTVIALIDLVTFNGCMELDARITTGLTMIVATAAAEITLTYRAF